ncbi:hypothetical protein TNCT_574811 [Trichonephila clavata]|uniref:Uncharacterized protein n=1 Tax=Trichonephila clavata TaxID=2740835 RepID=A0A8X6H488_TRICU|nr:hypothetical protein TNCT_574811 [Trichonephila clavata]
MVLPRPAARLRWGSVMFYRQGTTLPPVEEFRTELCIHDLDSDACRMVLLRPVRRYMQRSSVMFVTPRHDINRPVKNSEQNSVSTDLTFSCMRDGPPRPVRPVYAVG